MTKELEQSVTNMIDQFEKASASSISIKSPVTCMSDFSHDDVIEKLKKNGYEASIIRMPLLPNMPVRGRSLSAKWKRLRGKTDMYTGGKPKIKISKSAPVTI